MREFWITDFSGQVQGGRPTRHVLGGREGYVRSRRRGQAKGEPMSLAVDAKLLY